MLEVGCGACANLWMLAREGFRAYGLDLSEKSISLGREILKEWNAPAELFVGTMRELPLSTGMFDAVVDVFSSYCLTQTEFEAYCEEVARVLKPGGWYFSFTPSKNVNSYKQADPKDMIDANTLSGITDSSEPFYGNFYPFRFMAPLDAQKDLQRVGLDLQRTETTHRSYRGMSRSFEWLVLDAVKAG